MRKFVRIIFFLDKDMKFLLKTSAFLLLLAGLASCRATKDIVYFQDSVQKSQFDLATLQMIKVNATDRLSIVVSSKDPELAAPFNLITSTRTIGMGSGNGIAGGSNQMSCYTVNKDGDIDFPILGYIHVEGLTRHEIAQLIKGMLIGQDYIRDPVVTVEFADLFVSVIGEVKGPGRKSFSKDRITILDAIAEAGDLTINGLRTNVKVFREEEGRQTCYTIDLTSGDNVFVSPVYYLHQNDVVYVEPNGKKRRESTVNGNNLLSVPFWMSTGSFLMSISTMVIALINKK